MTTTPSRASGLRARVREEMRAEILAAARRELAEHGVDGLSLRAVAREVGLVSSAVYRYVPSRDALLTELIIEAYDALGDAVETAEAAVPREDYAGRYLASGRAARRWALAQPHLWALIYGSPIPGYAAPQDTVGPAIRLPLVLAAIGADAYRAGAVADDGGVPAELHDALELRSVFDSIDADVEIPDGVLVRLMVAWTYILGSISSQLFGQRHRVVAQDAAEAVYDLELDMMLELIGLRD